MDTRLGMFVKDVSDEEHAYQGAAMGHESARASGRSSMSRADDEAIDGLVVLHLADHILTVEFAGGAIYVDEVHHVPAALHGSPLAMMSLVDRSHSLVVASGFHPRKLGDFPSPGANRFPPFVDVDPGPNL